MKIYKLFSVICLLLISGCYVGDDKIISEFESVDMRTVFADDRAVYQSSNGDYVLTLERDGSLVKIARYNVKDNRKADGSIKAVIDPGDQEDFLIAALKRSETHYYLQAFRLENDGSSITVYGTRFGFSEIQVKDRAHLLSLIRKDIENASKTLYERMDEAAGQSAASAAEQSVMVAEEKRKKERAKKKAVEDAKAAEIEKKKGPNTAVRRKSEKDGRRFAECVYTFLHYDQEIQKGGDKQVYLDVLEAKANAPTRLKDELKHFTQFSFIAAVQLLAGPNAKSPQDPLFEAAKKEARGIMNKKIAAAMNLKNFKKFPTPEARAESEFAEVEACLLHIYANKVYANNYRQYLKNAK
ncbi:hypothetical protein [uncultured Hoeflea sp.]|uniref:hypothetical protein n=1 Tax=uncultured Hoeflea sp. TaxID=538666 RepID=UPI0030DA0E4A|tara:strand:- start:479 stop:1543 length:1065 start_codon:yes stop_codon:yes gene_type:complete